MAMATAESGEDGTVDDMGGPSWAWPAIPVSEMEGEAWVELEARLRPRVNTEEGK